MNPQNTTDQKNENVNKKVFISYLDAVNWLSNNRVLCNNIREVDNSIFDNMRFAYYNEEEDYYIDIFQYFITDFSLSDVEYLEKKFDLKFTYSNRLDCFVLCVDHCGTHCGYVSTIVNDEHISKTISNSKDWEYVETCGHYKSKR